MYSICILLWKEKQAMLLFWKILPEVVLSSPADLRLVTGLRWLNGCDPNTLTVSQSDGSWMWSRITALSRRAAPAPPAALCFLRPSPEEPVWYLSAVSCRLMPTPLSEITFFLLLSREIGQQIDRKACMVHCNRSRTSWNIISNNKSDVDKEDRGRQTAEEQDWFDGFSCSLHATERKTANMMPVSVKTHEYTHCVFIIHSYGLPLLLSLQ